MTEYIYLDYAATSPTDERVIEAMADCMRRCFANPSAAYAFAGEARREQRLTRRFFAKTLHCDPAELFFTSGGTESNNWAAQLCKGRHAAVSAIEHASVLETVRRCASCVTLIQPNADGVITPEAVEAALCPDTALVSVQWANNETGVIHPIAEISALLKKRRIPFHCDAVQAFGRIPVDASRCDLLTLSAHKFSGPRGAGLLYVRQGVPLPPLLHGGGQEMGQRAGTENTPAICGMRVAAQLTLETLSADSLRERELMQDFQSRLTLPHSIPGANAPRVPGILALHLPGKPSEMVIAKMDAAGICLSGGAACAAQSAEPSHVMCAMGLSDLEARCVIRVSIGRETLPRHLHACADVLNTF